MKCRWHLQIILLTVQVCMLKQPLMFVLMRKLIRAAAVSLHRLYPVVSAILSAQCFLERDFNYLGCNLNCHCQNWPVAPLITFHVELFAVYIPLIYTI